MFFDVTLGAGAAARRRRRAARLEDTGESGESRAGKDVSASEDAGPQTADIEEKLNTGNTGTGEPTAGKDASASEDAGPQTAGINEKLKPASKKIDGYEYLGAALGLNHD